MLSIGAGEGDVDSVVIGEAVEVVEAVVEVVAAFDAPVGFRIDAFADLVSTSAGSER